MKNNLIQQRATIYNNKWNRIYTLMYTKHRCIDKVIYFTDIYNFPGNTCLRIEAIKTGKRPWMDVLGACDMDVAMLRQAETSVNRKLSIT